jgi:plastocyanin
MVRWRSRTTQTAEQRRDLGLGPWTESESALRWFNPVPLEIETTNSAVDSRPALNERPEILTQEGEDMNVNFKSTIMGAIGLAFLAGCSTASGASLPATSTTSSSAPAAASPTAQAYSVSMTDANVFAPTTITVPRGATITWTNTGTVAHTVTDDPTKAQNPADAGLPPGAQAWDSGTVNGGATFSHTFDTAGSYTYFCIPHEALGMVAHVTVTP